MDDFEMDTTVADTEERICRASLNVTPEGEWTLYINFDDDCSLAVEFAPEGDPLSLTPHTTLSFSTDMDDIEDITKLTHADWRRWLTKAGFIPKPIR
jgi:hypothetical protein